MAAPPPDGMYLTDETLRREGYRTHPFSDDGRYIGSPKVRDVPDTARPECALTSPTTIPSSEPLPNPSRPLPSVQP